MWQKHNIQLANFDRTSLTLFGTHFWVAGPRRRFNGFLKGDVVNPEQTGTCNPVRREKEHPNAQCGQNHSDNSPKDDSGPGFSDVLPFGRLWYGEPNAISNAVGYANFYSRSHDAVIRV